MDRSSLIELVRRGVLARTKPSTLLKELRSQIKPQWEGHIPRIDVESILIGAIGIPLKEVRDIETWVGFEVLPNPMSDDELDAILQPWFDRYLEHRSRP